MWNDDHRNRVRASLLVMLLGCLALMAGCRTQEQNPFGAFGPATIPPPTIEVPGGSSYYPTPGGPAAAGVAPPPANSLPSISLPSISVPSGGTPAAEPQIPRPYSLGSLDPREPTAPAASGPTTRFSADPADREPIRVVEAAPGMGRSSREPVEISRLPQNGIPASPAGVPAMDRTRGFTPQTPAFGQPPAGTKSSGSIRTDPSVVPAAYVPTPYVPAFTESPAADGQWRSR